MKTRNRLLAVLLTLAMIAGMLPVSAFAEGDLPVTGTEIIAENVTGNEEVPTTDSGPADPVVISGEDEVMEETAEEVEETSAERETEPEPETESETEPETILNEEETTAAAQEEQSGETACGEDPKDEEKKEEKQEEKEEKTEEKDRLPAQSFSGSAGGLGVKALAGQGVFPEGTLMNVSAVPSVYVMTKAEALTGEGATVVDAKAVDITFTKDGVEIQPAAGSVKVTLSVTGALDGEVHEAIHISAGSISSMGNANAISASFMADHFSIYGIIGVNTITPQERHTYKFYVNNVLVDTQTVTDGDTLEVPQTPASVSGKVFREWLVTREDDTNIYPPYAPPFGTADIPVGDQAWADKTFRVDAVFDETYYVTFYKDAAKTSVLQTKAANKGAEITTNDVSFDFGNGTAITGWKNGEETVGSTITVTADIELIPVVSDVKWVKFEANGGTPVAPVYSAGNSAVSAPTPPTRSGYRFAGWFREAGLNAPYDFSKPVTEDITLYAKWNSADKVGYTVVYWKQNANDEGYTFVESEAGSDYAGEPAAYSANNNKYEGFTLNRAKSDVDVIIKGDGTTIKNVYYDRKTYPLTFYIYKKGSWIWSPSTWEKVAESTFKYQEDTSAFWNKVSQQYSSYQWFISENSSTFYSYAPPMQPANGNLGGFEGIKAYGKTASYTYKIKYLEEGSNRQIKETFTGRTSQQSIKFTNEDYIIIPGFTFKRAADFNRNREGTLYYTRNTYTLKLFPNGGPAPEGGTEYRGIKFEASLADYSPSNYKVGVTTAAFDGIIKTFAGWYDNELLDGSPFIFSSTMPALEAVKQSGDKSTLALYAKWVTEEFTVTFDLNGGTINGAATIAPETVEAGKTVTQPAGEMKKDGFAFGGWETEDGSLFHFDTLITADTDLVAIWHADTNEDIRIVYASGEMSESEFTDDKLYHRNAEAVLKGVPEVKEEYRKQGYYFKGWKVGDSDTLVSRGTFTVIDPGQTRSVDNKTLTLTAVYGQRNNTVSVTYNSNLPDGSNKTFTDMAEINKDYEILSFSETGLDGAGDEYDFIGWKTVGGQTLEAGNVVAVGRGGAELSAEWKKKDVPVKVVISGSTATGTYNGGEQEVTGFTWQVTKTTASSRSDADDLQAAVTVTLKDGKSARAAGSSVGTYYMGLELDAFEIVVAEGYKLDADPELNDGSIRIDPFSIAVRITGNNHTVPYSGVEEKVEGFSVEVLTADYPESFDNSKVLWMNGKTPEAKGTDPNTYMMGLDKEDFSCSDANFDFSCEVIDGWLKITPKETEEETAPEQTEEEPSAGRVPMPKTGDGSKLVLWSSVMIASMLAMVLVLFLVRRRDRRGAEDKR